MIDGDGRYVLYNDRLCELLGLPAEFLASNPTHQAALQFQEARGDFKHLTPETRARLADETRRLETVGESFVYEQVLADGHVLEIRNNPLPEGGWVRVFTDVTARKDAEKAVTEKTLQLELTLETMDQGILLLDESNRLTLYNTKAAPLLGVSPDYLAEGPTSQALVQHQRELGEFDAVDPAVWTGIEQIYFDQGRGIFVPFSYEREKPDGRWLYVNNIPVDGGGFLQTYLDITA